MGLGDVVLHEEAHHTLALRMPGEVWRKMEPAGSMIITSLQPIMLNEKYYGIELHLLKEIEETL